MLIAVYGTLRKGDGNHAYYLDGHEPLGIDMLEGYSLYSLGSYPYATQGDSTDEILVEVYDVDLETLVPMAGMEMAAGYEVKEVETDFGKAYMFVYSPERHDQVQAGERSNPQKILSGDWFEWLAKNRPGRIINYA